MRLQSRIWFAGLFAPIDRPNTMNLSKAGQAIPLKWRLTDADGSPVLDLDTATVTVSGVNCSLGAPMTSSRNSHPEAQASRISATATPDQLEDTNHLRRLLKSLNLNLGEGEPRTSLAYISFKK